jgi:hypothetical protein
MRAEIMNLKERLERGAALLDLIDQSRRDIGDPNVAANIERTLIERELRDLEAEALRSPGCPEHELVPVRLRRPR